ncbi:MAG: glutamate-1-semialdehyde 2,1-aminomutase [Phycisphaerae bacterium]
MRAQVNAKRAQSAAQFESARAVLVGGVNSPVRAFRAVGGDPVFVERAEGAYVYDVDGNRYVDLVGSWGPAIVGHAHPVVVEAVQRAADKGLSFGACCAAESELADVIAQAIPSIELLRFVNSGTEATMSAIRLARAATGRPKLIKFLGCYHGHVDALLVAAGSGAVAFGTPDSAGVPGAVARDTLLATYNDVPSVERIMSECGSDVAAVLVEPIAGNMGFVPPARGFLESLRSLCTEHGALLIFDEVMTGFRVSWGGYQSLCGVTPDLTCLGKVIGGGMPVAAYGGPRSLMELVSPLGPVYQAGTLSGNPVGMAAGIATLRLCESDAFYDDLSAKAARLTDGLSAAARQAGVALHTALQGGMFGMALLDRPVRNFEDAQACDHALYARLFRALLDCGVWLPPSGYEAMFVSAVHDDEAIAAVVDAARQAFRSVAA